MKESMLSTEQIDQEMGLLFKIFGFSLENDSFQKYSELFSHTNLKKYPGCESSSENVTEEQTVFSDIELMKYFVQRLNTPIVPAFLHLEDNLEKTYNDYLFRKCDACGNKPLKSLLCVCLICGVVLCSQRCEGTSLQGGKFEGKK